MSNFYGEPATFALPDELATGKGRLLLGNYPDSPALAVLYAAPL